MFIMKYFRCLSLVFVLFLVSSCFNEKLWKWLFPDDEPTLEQKEYTGDNLRIDGFYCYEPNDDEDHTNVFVLYKNGVVMGPYGTKYSIVEEKYFDLIKNKNKGYYIDIIDWWGLFVIENSSIYLEYHMPSMYGHHKYLMKGEILNDTTFHMTKGKQSDSSDYESIDQMYHFHKTAAKPDSTNIFFH